MITKPTYLKEDFKKLQYPVFDIPENKSILKALGRFFRDPIWKYPIEDLGFEKHYQEKNRLIKYIACVYDQYSPFNEDISDLIQRKFAAALYVGFELDKDLKFESHIEMIIFNMIPTINTMIVRYIRDQGDPEYAFIKAIEDDYYRQLEKVHGAKTYKLADIKSMKETLKKAASDLRNKDDSPLLMKELYQFVNEDNLKLRPEDIAKSLADGVQPITREEISND